MSVEILKRLMDGLNLSHEEAQAYLASMVVTCNVEDLVPDDSSLAAVRWRTCIGGRNVGAVAANNGMIHVRNWPGSGVLMIVDRMICWASGQGVISVRTDVTGYGTVATDKAFRDMRITGVPVAQLRWQNNVGAVGTVVGYVGATTWTPFVVEGPFVLDGGAAGQSIGICHETVNTSVGALFFWREKDFNPAG